jgi:hypothetical protein
MAGAGKKTFVQGNILNASEVNTYLMDQAVMVFTSTTARDTALPAGTRSEGMVCYITNEDSIYVYNGTAWFVIATAVGSGPGYFGAWTGYTPTYTNLTAGNGTSAFTYVKFGNTVHVRGRFTFGSTSSVSGSISLSLPVTAVSGNFVPQVTVRAGGVDYAAYMAGTTTTVALSAIGSAGTYANRVTTSATIPGTWTNGDNITFSATYEAA